MQRQLSCWCYGCGAEMSYDQYKEAHRLWAASEQALADAAMIFNEAYQTRTDRYKTVCQLAEKLTSEERDMAIKDQFYKP